MGCGMSEDGSDEVVASLSAVDLNQAVGGVLKLLQKIPESQRHLVIRTVCELSGCSVAGMTLGNRNQLVFRTDGISQTPTGSIGGSGLGTVQKSGVLDGGGKTDQAG
mgnify:CR=1 FL=1